MTARRMCLGCGEDTVKHVISGCCGADVAEVAAPDAAGIREVRFEDQSAGFIDRNGRCWDAWLYRGGRSVKLAGPFPTIREAVAEIHIEMEG